MLRSTPRQPIFPYHQILVLITKREKKKKKDSQKRLSAAAKILNRLLLNVKLGLVQGQTS
jgi:hypothetical protein